MTSAQRGIIGIVMAMIRFGMRVAEDGHQGERQDDERERQEDVHHPLQVEIDPPAEVGAAPRRARRPAVAPRSEAPKPTSSAVREP